MSRTGVTYLDVARCADAFSASGTDPTIERIRFQLKTGSNSTIGTHLRTWRSKQNSLHQLITQEKIPEELIVLLKGLWERVMAQAEMQVETIKNDAQQNLVQHKQTLYQLQQDNTRLQQSEAQLKQARDGLAQEKTVLEQIIIKTNTLVATLRAQYDGVLQQLADKQIRIDELQKQNQQTQNNLEHYRAASLDQRQQDQLRAEQQQRELTQMVQQLTMDKEIFRQQAIDFQHLHHELESTKKSTQAELIKATLSVETISAALTEANKIVSQKTESERHLKIQYDKIHAHWEEQMKITTHLQAQNAVLSQKITAMKETLDDTVKQNKVLAHDKWILGQEKAKLSGELKQATQHLIHKKQKAA